MSAFIAIDRRGIVTSNRNAPIAMDVATRGLERALHMYIVHRGKSDAEVVNKAMRYILPKAAGYIIAKTPGAGAIRGELTSYKVREKFKEFKERTGGTSRDAQAHYLRNTLAAAIIASRERKKGRTFFPKSYGGVEKGSYMHRFYEKVKKLIGARTRSASYLRAGFIPAFRAFGLPNRGPANQKRFKGRSLGSKAVPSLTKPAIAYAVNAREGAYKLDPNAFVKAIRVAQRTFLQWISEDMGRDGKRSGFF